jgi:predicted ATPase
MLKKLTIDNYRSFSDTTIEFGQLNALIGLNNAGKSNLIDAFEFLETAIFKNVTTAINEKGGLKNIRNYLSDSQTITFRMEMDLEDVAWHKYDLMLAEYNLIYSLIITADGSINEEFYVQGKMKSTRIHESDVVSMDTYVGNADRHPMFFASVNNAESYLIELHKKRYEKVELSINIVNNATRYRFDGKKIVEFFELSKNGFPDVVNIRPNPRFIFRKKSLFASFDLIPYVMKQTITYGQEKLKKEGTNLFDYLSALQNNNPEEFEEIATSLYGEVEGLRDIDIDLSTGVPELMFTEHFTEDKQLSFRKVSDGTIQFIALMSAICSGHESIILLEEPERQIHLKVIATLIDKMRSKTEKQFLMTSHSIEVLNQVELKELIFIYRDKHGFTKAMRGSDIPNIKKLMSIYKGDIARIIRLGILDRIDG